MAAYLQQTVESLKQRLLVVNPEIVLETGVFNAEGEIIMRLQIPGTKTIEITNLKALQTVTENLEAQKRLKERGI